MKTEPIYCEQCGKILKLEKNTFWLELNSHTGQWAKPGAAPWSGGLKSQGVFPFGRDCYRQNLP